MECGAVGESADVAYQKNKHAKTYCKQRQLFRDNEFYSAASVNHHSSHIQLIAQFVQDGKCPAGTEK
jgi:hypothetical protein